MIPNSGCHVHQPLLLFSGGRTEESADGGCLFSLWRTGARLAHLATRWHCSHKELWSQLHSSAVALRKSSRAEVEKGLPVGLRLLWIAGVFGSCCTLDVSRPLTAKKKECLVREWDFPSAPWYAQAHISTRACWGFAGVGVSWSGKWVLSCSLCSSWTTDGLATLPFSLVFTDWKCSLSRDYRVLEAGKCHSTPSVCQPPLPVVFSVSNHWEKQIIIQKKWASLPPFINRSRVFEI